jgi:hypothetical protein
LIRLVWWDAMAADNGWKGALSGTDGQRVVLLATLTPTIASIFVRQEE